MILVDTNVVLDLVTDDPVWKPWPLTNFESTAASDRLAINDVVYAEISVRFLRMEDVEAVLERTSLSVEPMRRSVPGR